MQVLLREVQIVPIAAAVPLSISLRRYSIAARTCSSGSVA
jgi:hypothetical protein